MEQWLLTILCNFALYLVIPVLYTEAKIFDNRALKLGSLIGGLIVKSAKHPVAPREVNGSCWLSGTFEIQTMSLGTYLGGLWHLNLGPHI